MNLTVVFNCLSIGFLVGTIFGYFLGYGDGKANEQTKHIFERLDAAIAKAGPDKPDPTPILRPGGRGE